MQITVTAAGGQLGRLVVAALLERGVEPGSIVAAVRTPAKVADLAERGVDVREADYTRPDTLGAAFAGTDRLLLVSSSENGARLGQHGNAVAAAREAGVGRVAYTSILHADTSSLGLAVEHLATERFLAESGLPSVLLRNGWYVENQTQGLAAVLDHGAVLGSAGDGRLSAAARRDYAEAAAAVLLADAPDPVYELGGDEAYTLTELAATITDVTGTPVTYRDLSETEHVAALELAGLPAPIAAMLADSDQGLGRGDLFTDSGDLSRLIGRPTTPLVDVVRAAYAALPAPTTR